MSDRIPALLAYLLLAIGWVYVLVFRKHDELAVYHTRQSIMLIIAAVGAFVIWAVLGWIVMAIPLIGPIVTASTFSLIVALYMGLAISWVVGIVYTLQAKTKPIPFVGRWAEQLPIQ